MVESPKPDGVMRVRGLAPALFLALVTIPAAAQTRLTLDQLGSRQPADHAPTYAGQQVIVRGVVSTPAYHFTAYTLLAFEDGRSGAVLQVPATDTRLDAFRPGDQIEAEGKVSPLFGMVTILPARITVAGRNEPPAPADVPLEGLMGFHYLGRLVRTEGRITEVGDNAGGAYLLLAASGGSYKLFIPRRLDQPMPSLNGLEAGDKVRVAGVALQYCPRPPYDHWFELLVSGPADIIPMGQPWFLPPTVLAAGLSVGLLVGLFLWNRERRLRIQRRRLRRTYRLGEQILGAASAEAILARMTEALPGVLGVTGVRLYVYNRAAKTLDAVAGESGEPVSISLSSPPGGAPAGAVACFHYRTLLVIPDISHSPFPVAGQEGGEAPKSLLFVPMMAQGEVIGVLELDQDDRVRDFTADEQALAQHLGNQTGVALRLLGQRSVQEQLFRTEKLAAVGRLISGVVNELQTPLASISELAAMAMEKAPIGPAEREVSAIAAEAQKAAGMVARLVSFAAAEQVEARPIDISALLRNLIEFREGDWKASGIRATNLTSHEPLFVLGSQGQLEQVFLNLFVHAEQWLADAPQKTISIRTSVLARRLLVEIAFSAPLESRRAVETAAVLSVTRSVIAGHGGEVRLIEKTGADQRFEVELPATAKERSGPAASSDAPARDFSRRRTALIIEPDEAAQRQVLGLLTARGYRVVPVTNTDNGLEMAHRMRFDAAFCSIHAPGLNWVELSERMHSRVGGFILLSDGYDSELSADFEGDGCFVLPKPVQEPEFDRLLRLLEPRAPVIPISKTGAA